MESKRYLKVGDAGDPYKGQSLPTLRLQGKWLAEAGFEPGSRVEIRVENGRLVLNWAHVQPDLARCAI